MKPIRIPLIVMASSLFLAVNHAQAVVIEFEDFEDSTVGYVLLQSDGSTTQNEFLEDVFNPPTEDDYAYFTRVGGDSGNTLRASTDYLPNTGNGQGFFAANNTDDPSVGADGFTTAFMQFDDIDISGFTNLTFSGAFAEDGGDNWNGTTELNVQARIDSNNDADFVDIFGLIDNGSGAPIVAFGPDAGTEITDTFASFTAAIAGTGSSLDVRIEFTGFNADLRDVALDDLSISGDAIAPVPEPTSLALLGALAACGGGYRLRRRRQTAEDIA